MTSNTTISHEIAATLRREILTQQYRSGERLPSERDLAARFSASRGAVREALSQLEQIGLISVQPGGARVKPIEEASIAILGPMLTLNEQPDPALVDQFLQTFAALAALNAREALGLANGEQQEKIAAMLAEMRENSAEFETTQRRWVELLEYLGGIADNLVVQLILNDLKAQFMERMVKEEFKPSLKKKVLNDLLQTLIRASNEGDRDSFASAVLRYFDELRAAVVVDMNRRLAS
jgi:DNA-binding FadR family transcriptional regulator